jgi:hypothetical protein
MNGCGQTQHTHWTAGVSHHTRGPTQHYPKTKHSITIYPGCVKCFIPSRTLLSIFEQVRVKSEHAMGYLKGRFSSLRGLRQHIGNTTDHKRALAWVKTCIIIHTLVSFVEEEDEDNEFIDELVREGMADTPGDIIVGQANGDRSDTARETQGQQRRTELKTMLFESLYDML